MGNFDRGNRSGGRGGFGRNNFGGGGGGFAGNRERPFMHKATCAECGKECEVPFKPSAGRDVFCSNCFEKRGTGEGRPERTFNSRPERHDHFEKRSFEKSNHEGGNSQQFKAQLDMLNSKLDKILKALSPAGEVSAKPLAEVLEVFEKTEAKPEKKIKINLKAKTSLKAKKKKAKV